MAYFLKEVLVVLLTLLTLASAARGQGPAFSPLPPDFRPGWQVVPGVPGVHYAPNSPVDLFRHEGHYFSYQGATWYRGKSLTGPWQPITAPPKPFYGIGAPYFKTPPGWAKGKKTGWQGAPAPPGQMKKLEGGKVPPGQMKKYNP